MRRFLNSSLNEMLQAITQIVIRTGKLPEVASYPGGRTDSHGCSPELARPAELGSGVKPSAKSGRCAVKGC